MRPDEEILDDIIRDGSVDLDTWPALLERLLSRLDHIAKNSFPKPSLPIQPTSQDIDIIDAAPSQSQTLTATQFTELSQLPETQQTSQVDGPFHSQDAAAGDISPRPMPPPPVIPSFPSPQPLPDQPTPPPDALHPEDLSLLISLTQILTTQFHDSPPHTIQRLAELLRSPNTHYHSLQKFLRAVQRVLSVSSTVSSFPLPQNPTETLSNGNGATTAFTLGSDESLGGALLTPIPWLTPTSLTEELVGDHEEVHINGVSQGELLRQEQELNIIPAVQVSAGGAGTGASGTGGSGVNGEGEGVGQPHAGGPPGLGPADVGPQPRGTVFPDPPKSPEEIGSPPTTSEVTSIDIVVADIEGKKEDEGMTDADADADADIEGDEEKKGDMEVDAKEEQPKEEKEKEDSAADNPSSEDAMQVDKVEGGAAVATAGEEKKAGDEEKKEES